MIKKLKLRESNADAISKVIRSRVVRDKIDEFRDNFYGDGTYAEKFGNEVTYHDITDVKCTIDDVWTEVLGNPGIWDIICHADVKWDWDEDTDTVGTQESFSFYYDPATDTIVDDADIHTMEQDMIPLVGESNKKVDYTRIRRLNEYSGQTQLDQLGRLFDILRDTDGMQGYMNEVLDDLSSLYLNMYSKGKASQAECIDFYDRVKPVLESLEYALEDVISESNIILTDKKYMNYKTNNESKSRTRKRSIKEDIGDEDGYAVQIHDMGKGYIHLLLFNDMSSAEQVLDSLEYLESAEDIDEEMFYAEIDYNADLADDVINEIDWRREVNNNDIWTASDDTKYKIIGSVDLWLYW